MAIYVGSVVIDVENVGRASQFWAAALHFEVRNADPDFVVLTDPHRRWSNVSIQQSDRPKAGPNRVHLDLYSDDQQAEVERLVVLGAVKLARDYPPDADYIVMADPDGNEFCVINSPFPQS